MEGGRHEEGRGGQKKKNSDSTSLNEEKFPREVCGVAGKENWGIAAGPEHIYWKTIGHDRLPPWRPGSFYALNWENRGRGGARNEKGSREPDSVSKRAERRLDEGELAGLLVFLISLK